MRRASVAMCLSALLAVGACGGRAEQPAGDTATQAAAAPAAGGDLTPFELKNGIGPVKTEIAVGAIDHAMAERGEKTFEGKCSACHKMDEQYVGPALREVTRRRTPTYIMNMILNPEGMYTRHPVARQLLAEHPTQMPNLGLAQGEARELVEYLREQAAKATKE